MDWPGELAVPSYFVRGQSFEELLVAFKAFSRESQRNVDRMMDDEEMKSTKPDRKLGIMKKKGGIGKIKSGKEVKSQVVMKAKGRKGDSVYDSKRPSTGVAVVVRNIPYGTSDGELRNHFSHIGRILSAKIDRDESNKSMGSGTVTFNTRKEALTVVESMQNTRLGERPIRVTLAE